MKYERSILKLCLKYTSHSVQNQIFIGLKCETLFRWGKLTLGYKNLVRANFSRWGKINKFLASEKTSSIPCCGRENPVDPIICVGEIWAKCEQLFVVLRFYHSKFIIVLFSKVYIIMYIPLLFYSFGDIYTNCLINIKMAQNRNGVGAYTLK